MPTLSPPKPSSLAERLQADQQQIQHQLADQTQQLLQQHEKSLKRLSYDALRSTRSAMERHAAELETMHLATAARMRWLLLWPVLMSVLVSVLMVGTVTTWSLHRLDQVNDAQRTLDESSAALAAQQQAQSQIPEPSPPSKRKRR